MSRRQQQRKRRDKPFDPLKVYGQEARPQKHSIWWRLLHTQWIVTAGIGVIALGTVFSYALSGRTGQTQRASDVRTFQTATPQAQASGTPDPNASPAASPAPTTTPIVRRYAAAPPMTIDENKTYFATITTDKGQIRVQLFPKEAPQAVNSFVFLAKNHYYDGLTFNRLIPGFVAQGGDAGSAAPGYEVPVEGSALKHDAGSLALARNNATGQLGGQFYISLSPQPSLDGKDTVIGKVVSGEQVLNQLPERNPERNPNAPAGEKIQSISIEEGSVG